MLKTSVQFFAHANVCSRQLFAKVLQTNCCCLSAIAFIAKQFVHSDNIIYRTSLVFETTAEVKDLWFDQYYDERFENSIITKSTHKILFESVVFALLSLTRLWPTLIGLLLLQQVFVTFRRIDDLLTMEEMEIYYRSPNKTENAVEFENFTGAWDVVEKTQVWLTLIGLW